MVALITRWRGLVALVATALGVPQLMAQTAPEKVLIAFDSDSVLQQAVVQNAEVGLGLDEAAGVLRLATGIEADWPGITFQPVSPPWDLSAFAAVAMSVKNLGTMPVTVNCRVDGPGGDGQKNSLNGSVTIPPGKERRLTVELSGKLPPQLSSKLLGMRGLPGGAKPDGIDLSRVTQIIVFVNKPLQRHSLQLTSIRAQGPFPQGDWPKITSTDYFPMIDRFGQFIHKQWPGKTPSAESLRQDILREQHDLAAWPGPDSWNQYGGWEKGPQLDRTGFFYVTKHEGQWWLVDPEGKLFWSHGVDCVGFSQGTTPISEREFYFAELPDDRSPLARFYGQASWAPHGYYQGRGPYRTFNFAGANLMRKYGETWRETASGLAHRRLRSWAMNTIANWSDADVYLRRQTPYVVSLSSTDAKRIEGSRGYWSKFPDPFDPGFRQTLDRRLEAERDRTAGDPWCIGYFIDNELGWGDEHSLAIATLSSPWNQPAKQAFLRDLQIKYGSIRALNLAWESSHASWMALAESRTPPATGIRSRADLEAFYTRIAETYFQECRDAVKRAAPNQLYLGCRFAWVNDRGAHAAARFCDVIGYNLYRDDVADFTLPDRLDKPVVIGEFHFGAVDRGMFHPGLRPTVSQSERAKAYRSYVTGALRNRFIVGTHWFQYGDQATTGRGDGENYQIGLVDVCDRPYPETIQAIREVGRSMYELRNSGTTGD